MRDFKNYFGHPDAAREDIKNLKLNHMPRNYIENYIKAYDRKKGIQILVGIKGSGKTDIRRYIESTDRAYIFNLDSDNFYLNIDTKQLTGKSGRIKNTIALEILRAFAIFIGNLEGNKSKTKEILKEAAKKTLNILKNIPEAVDVKTPFANVNLRKLLGAPGASVLQSAWKCLIGDIKEALKRKRAYIMIDDAEDVFHGIESNPNFLEGVARAVHDINDKVTNQLHVLLFLKYGIWRNWYENPREYDKVEDVISILSWDHDSLCEIIARRIARISNIEINDDEDIDIEKLWKKEFIWSPPNSFKDFSIMFTRHCVSGPRDIIVLCNKSKELAGSAKIDIEHLKKALKPYSENQINQINADFGDVYPGIHRFVDSVFQSAPAEMSGKEAADWIEKNGLLNKRVERQFANRAWFSNSSKEKLVSILYDVGFWGKKHNDGRISYSIEKPKETISELIDNTLVVHPAFRPRLGISDDTWLKLPQ